MAGQTVILAGPQQRALAKGLKKEAFLDLSCAKECVRCGSVFYRDKRCTWRHWARAKFCSRNCSSDYGRQIRSDSIPPIDQHFWTFAEVRGEDECWPWRGGTDKEGYGCFSYKRKHYRAARLSIILSGRSIPDGHHACHRCGNPACVNPRHLYPGSPVENNRDKIHHGTHRQGETCPASKLTEREVRRILVDPRPHSKIAADYGVSPSSISHIKKRKTWRHVQ